MKPADIATTKEHSHLVEHFQNQLEDYPDARDDSGVINDLCTIADLHAEKVLTGAVHDLVVRLRSHGSYTVGTLLTAVEAALGDTKQAEALKAIVRREMFLLIDRNQAELYEKSGEQEPGLAPKEKYIDGQDSLADAE